MRARSGPSPTSSNTVPDAFGAAATSCSRTWNGRKLPTQPITNLPSSPRSFRTPVTVRWRVEAVEVDAGRGDEHALRSRTPRRSTSSATMSVPQATTSAARRTGCSPRRSSCAAQPGRFTRPLRAPATRAAAGTNNTDGHVELAGQIDPGRVEELVALPDELDGRVARSTTARKRRRVKRRARSHSRRSLMAVLTGHRHRPKHGASARHRSGRPCRDRRCRLRRLPAQGVDIEHAVRRDHPRLSEHTRRRRRPTTRADPTRDRSELALRGGRQDEDDSCCSGRRRHSGDECNDRFSTSCRR